MAVTVPGNKGYDQAVVFITDNIISKLDGILKTESWRDPKSHLQEVSQSIDGLTPQYRVIEEVGPDHEKIFTLAVYVGSELMGKGTGHSKQIAQQMAASAALDAYKKRKTSKK